MARKALVILNRKARSGEAMADAVKEALTAGGIEVIEPQIAPGEKPADAIRRMRGEVDLIVMGGGDGTLHHAAEALVEAGLPVGVIPLGTANDLAHTLGLPADPIEACQAIIDGATRHIDLGRVNGKFFFNVAGMGLSVKITRSLTKEVKRSLGVFAYVKAAISVLWRARLFYAEILAGDETHHVRTVQIVVGNGRYYGGTLTVSEEADIDDHMLDLYSIEVANWWRLLLLAPRLRSGMLADSKYVRTLRGKRFEIRTRRPRAINTDGEVSAHTPATFEVVENALTVYVPRETVEGAEQRSKKTAPSPRADERAVR